MSHEIATFIYQQKVFFCTIFCETTIIEVDLVNGNDIRKILVIQVVTQIIDTWTLQKIQLIKNLHHLIRNQERKIQHLQQKLDQLIQKNAIQIEPETVHRGTISL